MNYGKLTAGTTKTAIDTAKPSEKGEIITYLSQMGDVLHYGFKRCYIIIGIIYECIYPIINSNIPNIFIRKILFN